MAENYNRSPTPPICQIREAMDDNLHSLPRRLIEMRIEHADLDSLIDRSSIESPCDELALRRMKKRRLLLRDQISRLEAQLDPPEEA
jgi:hypothetical protein